MFGIILMSICVGINFAVFCINYACKKYPIAIFNLICLFICSISVYLNYVSFMKMVTIIAEATK